MRGEKYIAKAMDSLEADEEISSEEYTELTEWLESEVMQYGTLHDENIDWKMVDKKSLTLLSSRMKSVFSLSCVILSIQRGCSCVEFYASLTLLHKFLTNHMDSCYPDPAKEWGKEKKATLRKIVMRSELCSSTIKLDGDELDCVDNISRAVDELKKIILPLDLKYSGYQKILNNLKKTLERTVSENEGGESGGKQSDEVKSHGELDTRDAERTERELRRNLYSIADQLTNGHPHEPIGYRVRRHAIWLPVTALPANKGDSITEMTAFSAERSNYYLESINSHVSIELLSAIEKSVSHSPFWITGHYMSYLAAKKLGYIEVAEAIRNEVRSIVNRLPDILERKFLDGTPFANSETCGWVLEPDITQVVEGQVSGDPWDVGLQESLKCAERGSFEEGLKMLESGLNSASHERSRVYWRLALAEYFEKCGLKRLAKNEYASIDNTIGRYSLNEWEPTLVKRVAHAIKRK